MQKPRYPAHQDVYDYLKATLARLVGVTVEELDAGVDDVEMTNEIIKVLFLLRWFEEPPRVAQVEIDKLASEIRDVRDAEPTVGIERTNAALIRAVESRRGG